MIPCITRLNGRWRKPTLHLVRESHWLRYTMEPTVKIGLIKFRFCPTTTNACGPFHMERQLKEFAVQTTVKSPLSLSVSTVICVKPTLSYILSHCALSHRSRKWSERSNSIRAANVDADEYALAERKRDHRLVAISTWDSQLSRST